MTAVKPTLTTKRHLRLIASPEMYFLQGFLGSLPALTTAVAMPENALQISILPPQEDEFLRLAADLWKEPHAPEAEAENLASFYVALKIPALVGGMPSSSLRTLEVWDQKNVTGDGKVRLATLNVDIDQGPLRAGSHAAEMLVEWITTGKMPAMGAYVTEGAGLQPLH